MKESCIDVVSRSAMTADATPVVLSSTERFRFRFMPMLVDNQNNPEQSVRGKLLLERKSKMRSTFLPIVLLLVKKSREDRQKWRLGRNRTAFRGNI